MVLVCIAGILPWTARNFVALRSFTPVRSNFWPEFYFGNVNFSSHPTGDSMIYQHEGEITFSEDLRKQVLASVAADPKTFLLVTGARIVEF